MCIRMRCKDDKACLKTGSGVKKATSLDLGVYGWRRTGLGWGRGYAYNSRLSGGRAIGYRTEKGAALGHALDLTPEGVHGRREHVG